MKKAGPRDGGERWRNLEFLGKGKLRPKRTVARIAYACPQKWIQIVACGPGLAGKELNYAEFRHKVADYATKKPSKSFLFLRFVAAAVGRFAKV